MHLGFFFFFIHSSVDGHLGCNKHRCVSVSETRCPSTLWAHIKSIYLAYRMILFEDF